MCAFVSRVGPRVQAGVFETDSGPDRLSMDGGAWIPHKIRHLPRWHHSGFYQLYPGEGKTPLNASFPRKDAEEP